MKVPQENFIIKRPIRLFSIEFKKMVDNIDFHKENINDMDNSNKNYKIEIEDEKLDEDKKVNKDEIRVISIFQSCVIFTINYVYFYSVLYFIILV